ncbi:hypothetical protein PPK13_gp14 [Bacillus phage Ray17]|uniref:Uncharacterized protein n=1 Tax=Bacillus phage Ray17 TaxID=2315627 RepID=A0A386K9H5_9CAUD|nr:hypothetical protein PPK13_gp14 [Bacillus phage Ray17]AYD80916.1 hypothetical protein Ray17_15 [Bacillus phage Ray17]
MNEEIVRDMVGIIHHLQRQGEKIESVQVRKSDFEDIDGAQMCGIPVETKDVLMDEYRIVTERKEWEPGVFKQEIWGGRKVTFITSIE